MAEAIERFRPDVAHLHNVYHQLSPSILAPLHAAGVPVVLTLHDYKLVCPTYQLLDHGEPCTACVGGKFWNAPLEALPERLAPGQRHDGRGPRPSTPSPRSYRHVDAFICPSRFLAEQMARGRVYPDRMHVIRHFVDLDGVEAKSEPGRSRRHRRAALGREGHRRRHPRRRPPARSVRTSTSPETGRHVPSSKRWPRSRPRAA